MITTNKGLADIAGINTAPCDGGYIQLPFIRNFIETFAPDEAFSSNGVDWSSIFWRSSSNKITYSFKGSDFLIVEQTKFRVRKKKGKHILQTEIEFMAVGQ